MDSTLTVQLKRDPESPPLIEQLAMQIRRGIEEGSLPGASRLPSTRALARQLAVSRTVTSEAYATLLAEGYLESRQGSGTFVVECPPPRNQRRGRGVMESGGFGAPAPDLASIEGGMDEIERRPRWLPSSVDPPHIDPPADPDIPFRICEPDVDTFPDRAWRTAARAAINEAIPEGYPPPLGDGELRRAIAAFLFRERGLHISPEELIVTSGTTQSLDLIARATLRRGDTVAFEDPGYRLARQIFMERGVRLLPIPVDEEGLRTDGLVMDPTQERPMAVYLTPSHQFPCGSALSYRRRLALLEWAARHEVLLIEDDYDSEFRFDGPVLPSLRSSDEQGCVTYLGTFSKSLSPRLRLGYLIAPPALREAVARLKVRTDQGSNWLNQRILARYLMSGGFTRHLRRMRRLYRRRRDLLIQGLGPLPRGARWSGLAAGLHASLLLPDAIPAERIVELCRGRGIVLATLAFYQASLEDFRDSTLRNGLVLGYGASDESQIEKAADVLRWALGELAEMGPKAAAHGQA